MHLTDKRPSLYWQTSLSLIALAGSLLRAHSAPAFQSRLGAITRGPTDSKRLALVFTGHEYAEGGQVILDALERHEARASFFLTGDFLVNTNFISLVGKIAAGGHYIGPHSDKHLLYCSWDADRKTLVSRSRFCTDLVANRQKISDAYKALNIGVMANPPVERMRFFLPPYEHYNEEIASWTVKCGMTLINFTPGTRSNADYTGEADKNFVDSETIFDSIVKREREDPHGLNGFLLLLHIGAGPGRADKFHTRFPELLDFLKAGGYELVRVDELLTEP